MNLQFGQTILYSKDPQLLGNFFSELLDKQLIELEDGYILEDPQYCPFKFTAKSKGQNRPSDKFQLFVEDQFQMDELKQKISFFIYRHQLKDKLFKMDAKENHLDITDLDGRVWSISLQ